MMSTMIGILLSQLFRKPATNPFPAPYAPDSTLGFLKAVGEGKAKILPPVPVPEGFRGCVEYNSDKCIGCRLCTRVCPANAIEFLPDQKKVRFHIDRCCFCAECRDICPTKSIALGNNFLLAYYDRNTEATIEPAKKVEKSDEAVAN